MILILYVLQQEFLREKSFIKNRPDFDNKKTHLNYITLNRRTYSSSVWAGTRAHTRPRAHTRALPAPCSMPFDLSGGWTSVAPAPPCRRSRCHWKTEINTDRIWSYTNTPSEIIYEHLFVYDDHIWTCPYMSSYMITFTDEMEVFHMPATIFKKRSENSFFRDPNH